MIYHDIESWVEKIVQSYALTRRGLETDVFIDAHHRSRTKEDIVMFKHAIYKQVLQNLLLFLPATAPHSYLSKRALNNHDTARVRPCFAPAN